MAELIDFDAFRAEQRQETIPIKVNGIVYQVPATPPAAAVLDAIRLNKAGPAAAEPETIFALAKGILGTAGGAIIRDGGLTIPELMALLQLVSEQQSAAITPPPNREARRAMKRQSPSTSSSGGRSSKRTSSASTASTFASN